jgi:hypothetical protein
VLCNSLWPCGVARDYRACRLPTPTLTTQSRELLLFRQHNDNPFQPTACLLPAHLSLSISHLSSICVLQDTSPSTLRHLNESSRPLPFPSMPSSFIPSPFIQSYHSLLACHTCHVHAACTHLNLVYLYQPIVIGEAFRLLVILLLLALPCLNSLTRCVITCPIWLNNPRQRGLEVFVNLSQSRLSPQAAAILTSSGFFLPCRFHKL